MPQTRYGLLFHRQVYWWSRDIAALREERNVLRRLYTRSQRKCYRDEEMEAQLYGYREAKAALQLAIRKAKIRAWDELLEALEEDPGAPLQVNMQENACMGTSDHGKLWVLGGVRRDPLSRRGW